MAPPLIFRKPQPGDALAIYENMRDMDALECRAHGHHPLDALRAGLRGSVEPLVVEGPHGPLCAFGIIPQSILDGLARPWLLGTHDVPRYARALLGLPKPYVAAWLAEWPKLENWVHRDNHASIAWLRYLGFDIHDEAVDIGGHPFRRFTKGMECAIQSHSP